MTLDMTTFLKAQGILTATGMLDLSTREGWAFAAGVGLLGLVIMIVGFIGMMFLNQRILDRGEDWLKKSKRMIEEEYGE